MRIKKMVPAECLLLRRLPAQGPHVSRHVVPAHEPSGLASLCVSVRDKEKKPCKLSLISVTCACSCMHTHILPRTPRHTCTYTTYIPTCTHRTKKTRAHTQTRTHARMHRQTDRQTDTHTHTRATSEQKRNESHEKHRNGPGSVSRPTCTIC